MRSLHLYLAGCLALLAVTTAEIGAQTASSGRALGVHKRLQKIIIPRLEFREATAREAIEFLARKARELERVSPDETAPILDFDPAKVLEVRITLSLRNVSLDEALRLVAAEAGARLTFTGDRLRLDAASTATTSRLGSRLDDTRLSARQRALLAKTRQLIVPRLEFREATLNEAGDFLRKKSADLDVEEPNPANRGINLVLLPPPPLDPANRLTMSLLNTPLLEILTMVAQSAGGELRLTDTTFILDFAGATPAKLEGGAPAVP